MTGSAVKCFSMSGEGVSLSTGGKLLVITGSEVKEEGRVADRSGSAPDGRLADDGKRREML